jgi:hypothetical protein
MLITTLFSVVFVIMVRLPVIQGSNVVTMMFTIVRDLFHLVNCE